METKRCTKCGEVKPVDAFVVIRARKCGRDFWCKVCRREKVRAYRAKTRDRINANDRSWRAANPDKVKEYRKREQERHPEAKKSRAKAGLGKKREVFRKHIAEASDYYIKQVWGIVDIEGPDSLVEAKRQQLMAHRALREFQKFLKEQTK